MLNRDIFYGRDIPKLFPKPEFWPEMGEIEPDEIYTIEHYNYNNRHISFQRCRWLKPSEGGDEVQELAKAKADGRLVVLPCKVEELMEKYRELTESEGADEAETYTTGYRNGHRNGQTELLAYLLQIDTGCREAAEKALEGMKG